MSCLCDKWWRGNFSFWVVSHTCSAAETAYPRIPRRLGDGTKEENNLTSPEIQVVGLVVRQLAVPATKSG